MPHYYPLLEALYKIHTLQNILLLFDSINYISIIILLLQLNQA